eukprot:TRINITY_DN4389_c0_g2_i11.p1 TRINITY_DN4389_c0_g2~~TRINITY_DN4389_c0_g2_i11.p1  ORF type:complete len:216 (+),score=28.37 TRINITY_DN4389_c0_g2_i11:215-862(+)
MALRRNARQRKEYLYRRSLQGKEQERYEKKRLLREALKEGKPIPTELRDMASSLAGELEMEDDLTFIKNSLDDEYSTAGFQPPKIMITTSHEPSSTLLQFAKELKLVFPGLLCSLSNLFTVLDSQRMNRGGHQLVELITASRTHGITDLIIVNETRGRPDGLIVSHLPSGPTAYFNLSNVVTRHDIKEGIDKMSTVKRHLILHNFKTNLGLSFLF